MNNQETNEYFEENSDYFDPNEEPSFLEDEEEVSSEPLEPCELEEPEDCMTDVEADADTLKSAGYGTDEDYYPDTPLGDEYGGE